MRRTFEFVFKDVYGGDGQTRPMPVAVQKLLRTRSSVKVSTSLRIPIESGYEETVSEKTEEQVNTFEYNEEGKPLLRLGGSHGKFWGAMREARLMFYHLGRKEFRSAALLSMIQVTPVMAVLEPLTEMETRTLPQKLNTPGSPMITLYFDVLPQAKTRLTLEYPDDIDPQITTLLGSVASMGLFNKRRATLESIEEVDSSS